MVYIELGLYVRIEQLKNGPKPEPLLSGFSHGIAYRVMGLHAPSETSEAYLILSNDRDQIWFISNKHVRTAFIDSDTKDFHVALPDWHAIGCV